MSTSLLRNPVLAGNQALSAFHQEPIFRRKAFPLLNNCYAHIIIATHYEGKAEKMATRIWLEWLKC